MAEISNNMEEYVSVALDIGEKMLISGAEISRVEDTIERICVAYGSVNTHVFTVTSGIIVTAFGADGICATQLRRIKTMKFNLHKLDLLNQLSRDICNKLPTPSEVTKMICEIDNVPVYSFKLQTFAYFFISGAFSVFFGGSARDMIAASFTGIVMCLVERYLGRMKMDGIFTYFACSLLGGLCNVFFVRIGLGENFALTSMGNIMLFIPGIAMTNAVRDMFQGDTLSGISRLVSAITLALIVTFGFTVTGVLV
ncbi:MAG: threonine/serine exporter family protein [Oscillospiraceae bacterium]